MSKNGVLFICLVSCSEQEIQIHKTLKHDFIVGFHSFFEDDMNVYIVLELCGKKVRKKANLSLGKC
jgi:serine/threonine protein kinase